MREEHKQQILRQKIEQVEKKDKELKQQELANGESKATNSDVSSKKPTLDVLLKQLPFSDKQNKSDENL